jgi:hypothetical protein
VPSNPRRQSRRRNFVHAEWFTPHDNPEFCVFVDFLRAELDRIGSEQADLSHNFSVVLLPSNFPS